jgi:hypothetical protein
MMADPHGVQGPAAVGGRSRLPDIEPFFVGGSTAEIGKHRFVATRSRSRAPQALRPVADPELAKVGAWGAASPLTAVSGLELGITRLPEMSAPMETPAAVAGRPRRRFRIPRPGSGAAGPSASAQPALSFGSWISGASAGIATLSGHVAGATRSVSASGGLRQESLEDALKALSGLSPREQEQLRWYQLSQLSPEEQEQLRWYQLSQLRPDEREALRQWQWQQLSQLSLVEREQLRWYQVAQLSEEERAQLVADQWAQIAALPERVRFCV